jgi:hypothetical protein
VHRCVVVRRMRSHTTIITHASIGTPSSKYLGGRPIVVVVTLRIPSERGVDNISCRVNMHASGTVWQSMLQRVTLYMPSAILCTGLDTKYHVTQTHP